MTVNKSSSSGARLEARLHEAWLTETRRAEPTARALLERAARRPTRGRVTAAGAGGSAALAGAALVVAAIAIVIFGRGPAADRVAPATASAETGTAKAGASATAPTSAATPGVRFGGGLPVEINGEHVYSGDEILSRKDAPGPFLVAGRLADGEIDCATSCPGGSILFLRDVAAAPGEPLLSAQGLWRESEVPRWPGNIVVLRVEQWTGPCQWATSFCAWGLLV